MNASFNASENFQDASVAAVVISPARRLYWLVRRELWEYRSIYIAPLIAAAVFLIGFVVHMVVLRRGIHGAWSLAQQRDIVNSHNLAAAGLIMGTAFIVGIFYSLDALYGERGDRSILFWKSLPVSDLLTVLSKLAVPLVILPAVGFAVAVVTQFFMLVLGRAVFLGTGLPVEALWTPQAFLRVSGILLYHIVTMHGLWYAPLYGWLLLVSAWSRRAPFLWAFVPPFVVCGVEKVVFNSSHFLSLLRTRFLGSGPISVQAHAHAAPAMDFMADLIPHHFLRDPGMWSGLALAAIFVAAATLLRRYRGPV